jgi:hypothetical protein
MNFKNHSQLWVKVDVPYAYDVYWTLRNAPTLTCNGLFVTNVGALRSVPKEVSGNKDAPILYPLVSIIDPNGSFPLNLERNNIRTEGYEFGAELIRDSLQEMLAWLLFEGPDRLDSPHIRNTQLPWLDSSEENSALVACQRGYGLRLVSLLDGLPIRHSINYHRGQVTAIGLSDDTVVFGYYAPWESRYGSQLARIVIVDGTGDGDEKDNGDRVKLLRREVSYSFEYASKKTRKSTVVPAGYYHGDKVKLILEEQNKGWLVAKEAGCPDKEFHITSWPDNDEISLYWRNRPIPYITECFFPEGSYIKAKSKPWLLDDLWQEYFGKNWIPFALEDRIKKFPQAAKFFAERYPQVVPDEAWVLLGGKPTP